MKQLWKIFSGEKRQLVKLDYSSNNREEKLYVLAIDCRTHAIVYGGDRELVSKYLYLNGFTYVSGTNGVWCR